ncbi:MAG: sulfite exporter TauE/SafE family protein [Burkholderiaceae bacterium]
MSISVLLLLFCLGAVVGVLAGLMGIGGGMVMVPFLIAAFKAEGYPPESLIKMAIATSLATIIFTAVSSVWGHHQRGSVIWPAVRIMAPGIMLGALVGAQLVGFAPAALVSAVFAGFLLWSAWSIALKKQKTVAHESSGQVSRTSLAVGGIGIGSVSSVVGAGGGFLTVPFLIRRGMAPARAVACSAACGLPIALAGTVGYIIAGERVDLAGAVVGFIHIPALLAIAAASVMTAPFGVKMAHHLSPENLRKVMGVLLTMLAAYMISQTFAALMSA